MVALLAVALVMATDPAPSVAESPPQPRAATAAIDTPNVFIYHLDDLRDALPGSIDPLQYMPKTLSWMAAGRRYTQSFVNDPSCCPSRASMLTGRYPHNNGVLDKQDGPQFPPQYSLACYLQRAGYATYLAGKFLTTWPQTQLPPCFANSTVIWGGYNNVAARVNGVARRLSGYSTTALGVRGREYLTQALPLGTASAPFLLYEAPQAPHWMNVTTNGVTTQYAVPETKYATAPVAPCAGVPEPDRSDKPAYVRNMNYTTAQAQTMCASQMRAIMSADDQFAATMQLLSDRGVLANTLVIVSSDNGFLWGEHGRWEKFTPYEPAIRTPLLLRWPGHIPVGTDTTRLVTLVDVLPTVLAAAAITPPPGAPRLDGESLLAPSTRTTVYAEYDVDEVANPNIRSWRMIRTRTVKYVHTYNAQGAITAREYYNLTNDPNEHTNLLGDASTANNPPAATLSSLASQLNTFATCAGTACVR
ncbi:MAG: sulfatase-like hydrolase/transferase [Actinomycetota bacterium]